MLQIAHHNSIEALGHSVWSRLAATDPFAADYPFLNYAYLHALESSGSVGAASGWQPHHLSLSNQEEVIAVIPCYVKYHSRGEYVFDWSWANAARQLGLNYYPKLLCAIPFTPCPGPRWLSSEILSTTEIIETLREESIRLGLQSWHMLFPAEATDSANHLLLERHDCQFHWHNHGYSQMADFLDRLNAAKRKNIRKERRKIETQGIKIERRCGEEISPRHLEQFYQFYCHTYFQRGQQPYLNLDFFTQLLRAMPQQLMLVSAYLQGQSCGCALFLFDRHTLYGRWWGGDPRLDCLHFELCYYQGIEFAIERQLQRFDPGTQGEHKLIRGFEPLQTRSYHQLHAPQIQAALQRWTTEERAAVAEYRKAAQQALPFRQGHVSPPTTPMN